MSDARKGRFCDAHASEVLTWRSRCAWYFQIQRVRQDFHSRRKISDTRKI